MTNQVNRQAVLVEQTEINSNQMLTELALFNPDGTPVVIETPVPQTGLDLIFTPVTTDTAIATAPKTTVSDEPVENTFVLVKFTNGNSVAAPTVSFNGGVARAILLGGTAPSAAEITVAENGVVFFWFDGTNLHQFGVVV